MLYSPAHGDTAFTVPLFGAFMKREMPDWRPAGKEEKAKRKQPLIQPPIRVHRLRAQNLKFHQLHKF